MATLAPERDLGRQISVDQTTHLHQIAIGMLMITMTAAPNDQAAMRACRITVFVLAGEATVS